MLLGLLRPEPLLEGNFDCLVFIFEETEFFSLTSLLIHSFILLSSTGLSGLDVRGLSPCFAKLPCCAKFRGQTDRGF